MNKKSLPEEAKKQITRERWKLLRQLEDFLELPLIILGLGWLVLLVIEFTRGLNPILEVLSIVIWGIFILDFLVKIFLAPSKLTFIKKNILTIVSLILPAFRVFRLATFFRYVRVFRATRGIRLVKVLGSFNRGMRSLKATLGRRGFAYVMGLTMIVIFSGSAGMLAFEKDSPDGIHDYGTALWWTTMLITSIGSEFWPKTTEGRILTLFIAIYGFAVFGYFTATIASFFVDRDAEEKNGQIAGAKQLESLRKEIILLRKELKQDNKLKEDPNQS